MKLIMAATVLTTSCYTNWAKKWCEILDQPDLDWKKDIIFHLKLLKTQNYNDYIIESIMITIS